MTIYVLGFLFNMTGDHVALIRKNKPDWQKGKLNGIGGKVEPSLGELGPEAMIREFKEETGVKLPPGYWKHFCDLSGDGFRVICYYAHSNLLYNVETKEDEEIVIAETGNVNNWHCIPNIRWLIPMALSFGRGEKAKGFSVEENC